MSDTTKLATVKEIPCLWEEKHGKFRFNNLTQKTFFPMDNVRSKKKKKKSKLQNVVTRHWPGGWFKKKVQQHLIYHNSWFMRFFLVLVPAPNLFSHDPFLSPFLLSVHFFTTSTSCSSMPILFSAATTFHSRWHFSSLGASWKWIFQINSRCNG